MRVCRSIVFILIATLSSDAVRAQDASEVRRSMRLAAESFAKLAVKGGYVYYYVPDENKRLGEGVASDSQVWVQPPGTPTVGMAFLAAWEATDDPFYLEAATAAGEALVYGQLQSGAWTNSVDFDPRGSGVAQYRNGKGKGRNFSTLDDGISQAAIQLLVQLDKAHDFKHKSIHEAAEVALTALLSAQFANGAFPQGWDGPVERDQRIQQARFPDHDWRTEGRIKEYWDMYTLNDNVTGAVFMTLRDAHRVYQDDRYYNAARRLGDFLVLAQMPEPQTGWAQQYNYDMEPIWARRFEPPAVAGDETQEAIQTLIHLFDWTGDKKYLEPIPAALRWLAKSQLDDGRMARYYELRTNRPLYMSRRGRDYSLTYDDSDLPSHYGWKVAGRFDELRRQFRAANAGEKPSIVAVSDQDVRQTLRQLDANHHWVSRHAGEPLVGQPRFRPGQQYIASAVFSANLELLSAYLSE